MCIRDSGKDIAKIKQCSLFASRGIFSRSSSAITPGEKSSIITNRKSTMHFPMILRWTVYIAPKPPKSWAQKCKMAVSRIKVDFFQWKSATKFLCMKTDSGIVVRHSLAYLTVCKWFVGDVPLNINFACKQEPTVVATANASDAHISTKEIQCTSYLNCKLQL